MSTTKLLVRMLGALSYFYWAVGAAIADAQHPQAQARASPRAVPKVPPQPEPAQAPPADSQAVPSSSSQPLLQPHPSSEAAVKQFSSTAAGDTQQPHPSSSSPQLQPPSAQCIGTQQQLPSSASIADPPLDPHTSAAIALHPSASSPQHLSPPPDTAYHFSSPPAAASNTQLRVDSGRSARSHQKEQPQVQAAAPLRASTHRQSPPPQELLAGLGSALRAQSRLRQKATAAGMSSPEDRRNGAKKGPSQVSPSGQPRFDPVELKKTSASGAMEQIIITYNSLCLVIFSGVFTITGPILLYCEGLYASYCPENDWPTAERHERGAVCMMQLDTRLTSCWFAGTEPLSAAASTSGRAGLIAASSAPSRLYQKQASDPGRDALDDPLGQVMVASHILQQSNDNAVHLNPGQRQHASKVSLTAHSLTHEQHLAHSGPSIEIVGTEMYEFELGDSNADKADS